ncbi:SH3 domain-containing protein [Hyalangium versicolor]|uniref:SH3 domain-containing protein n=1 Tax=Hyalangium versicolor TaxID=2861190 RepID=UPI001CCBD902|nr:SH3 domain-containing protein [Hyalangium versicolor]
MAPALLLSLLLSQPKILLYAAHGDSNELASYDVSTWEPGHKLFTAVDQASLRDEPNEEAAVVASLPMGSPVTVVQRSGERVRVIDRVDYWYLVEAKGANGRTVKGHLFGNLLTPLRLEGDLDGDGEKEIATVAMTSDFKIRVRVMEPKLPPNQRVANVDLQPAGSGLGGSAKVSLVEARKAGVALLMVESLPEADSNSFKAFLSYVVPNHKRGELGTVMESLTLAELVAPPMVVRHVVSFDRRRKRLLSVETRKGELKSGKTVKVRHVYQWKDGLYIEERKRR